jgi:hypothetical protein
MKNIFFALFLVLLLPLVGFSQDLATQLDITNALSPTTGSSDLTGSAIDNRNFKSTLIGIYSSANASWSAAAFATVEMTHCASSTGTFTAVIAQDVVGVTPDASGTIHTFDEATTADSYNEVLYLGRYPYFKIAVDMTGVLDVATPTIGVVAVQGGKILAQ